MGLGTRSPAPRLADWPTKLAGFLAERSDKPFAWGTNDCALFAADAILAMTGVDLAADYRGQYHGPAGAKLVLDSLVAQSGGFDLASMITSLAVRQGWDQVDARMAQRGDLVLFEGGHGPTLGIIGLNGAVMGPGTKGLEARPISDARLAWRI